MGRMSFNKSVSNHAYMGYDFPSIKLAKEFKVHAKEKGYSSIGPKKISSDYLRHIHTINPRTGKDQSHKFQVRVKVGSGAKSFVI